MAAENIIKMDRFDMADENIITKDRFNMAAENIIKNYRFKISGETSPYIALSSDGDVSTTLYDDFFTDAKNEFYVRFTLYMQNVRFKWRRGRGEP